MEIGSHLGPRPENHPLSRVAWKAERRLGPNVIMGSPTKPLAPYLQILYYTTKIGFYWMGTIGVFFNFLLFKTEYNYLTNLFSIKSLKCNCEV